MQGWGSKQESSVKHYIGQFIRFTWHVPPNAVCDANHAAVTVTNGADTVQCTLQAHPVVCMKGVSCKAPAALSKCHVHSDAGAQCFQKLQ